MSSLYQPLRSPLNPALRESFSAPGAVYSGPGLKLSGGAALADNWTDTAEVGQVGATIYAATGGFISYSDNDSFTKTTHVLGSDFNAVMDANAAASDSVATGKITPRGAAIIMVKDISIDLSQTGRHYIFHSDPNDPQDWSTVDPTWGDPRLTIRARIGFDGTDHRTNIRALSSRNIANVKVTCTAATLTNTGGTAHVALTGHGQVTGTSVTVTGMDRPEWNGTFPTIFVDANNFDYTMTGTPSDALGSPLVVIDAMLIGEYNVNGNASGQNLRLWISVDDGFNWTVLWEIVTATGPQNFRHIQAVYQSPIDGPDGTTMPFLVCLGDTAGGMVLGPSTFTTPAAAGTGWSAINDMNATQIDAYIAGAGAGLGFAIGHNGDQYRNIEVIFHNGNIFSQPDFSTVKGIWKFNGIDLSTSEQVYIRDWYTTEGKIIGGGALKTPSGNLLIIDRVETPNTTNKLRVHMSEDGETWGTVGYFDLEDFATRGSAFSHFNQIDDRNQIRITGVYRGVQNFDTERAAILVEDINWNGIETRLNVDKYQFSWPQFGSYVGNEEFNNIAWNGADLWGEGAGGEDFILGAWIIQQKDANPGAGGALPAIALSSILTLDVVTVVGTPQPFTIELRTGTTQDQPSAANYPSDWTSMTSTKQFAGILTPGIYDLDITTLMQESIDFSFPIAKHVHANMRIRTTNASTGAQHTIQVQNVNSGGFQLVTHWTT